MPQRLDLVKVIVLKNGRYTKKKHSQAEPTRKQILKRKNIAKRKAEKAAKEKECPCSGCCHCQGQCKEGECHCESK